jgi:hypothetical protein
MINTNGHRKLRDATIKVHEVEGHRFHLSRHNLSQLPDLSATYLRIAADLIAKGAEIDFNEVFTQSHAWYLEDDTDNIVSFLLTTFEEETGTLSVTFAWTHPGMRKLGLFRLLMGVLIECLWETKSISRLRTSPPVMDQSFNDAVTKMKFFPLSYVTEYRPYQ